MKKTFCLLLFVSVFFIISCGSTPKVKLAGEKVEYRDMSYESKQLKRLSEAQIREDIDYLNYIFKNMYAGYDEAAEKGFNLDAICQEILTDILKEKDYDNKYSQQTFGSIIYQKISKAFPLADQHIAIWNSLKNHYSLYYSNIYFEKSGDNFFVKFSDVDEVKPGQKYTGNPDNLFETLHENEFLYRFGVIANVSVKTASLRVDENNLLVKVKAEKAISTKNYRYNVLETDKTAYFSLSDCSDVFGLEDNAKFIRTYFDDYLNNLSVAAANNKKDLIFDLRSNGGGRNEFPAEVLTAALYANHSKEEQQQIAQLFSMKVRENCRQLVSPVTMQCYKNYYSEKHKAQFNKISESRRDYMNAYWKVMKNKPLRTYIDAVEYESEYSEFPETDFKGTLYILINSYTASASELGIGMAYMFKDMGIDVKLVGEMSSGAVKYVACLSYPLPNSGVYISAGTVSGLAPIYDVPNFKGEAKGFYPDYWASNEEILNTLIYCTGDEELKEVLKGLEKSQL